VPVPGVPTLTDPEPRVRRHPDAAAFLTATSAFRAREPVLTNILGSVAAGVVAGRRYDSELWLTIHRGGGSVAGIAMRTAPWNLAVSPMDDDSARTLGRFIAREDPAVPGITGPRSVVEAALAGLASPRPARVAMVDVARVLRQLTPPSSVAGTPRRATAEDRSTVLDWHRQFGTEAGLPLHMVDEAVDTVLDAESLWLWTVAGRSVAMAGHAPPVDTPGGRVTRVGPVYTPPQERGRGFASALTAHVSESLRRTGSTVMLFADAANAQANRIYERLGFEEVAEIVEVTLDD
jgi:predicted GNAT family acetyltransferase